MYIGDHISVLRGPLSGFPLYQHHMIVVKVISGNTLRVIHYRKANLAWDPKKTIIAEEDIIFDPSIDVIYRINYGQNKSYTGQEAIIRAWTRLGECSYDLLSNNCESFCTWVKMNENKSFQAETGMDWAAGIVALGTLMLLTFTAFKAFSGGNKSSK